MNIDELFAFLQQQTLAIVATRHSDGSVEAALVGVAITSDRHFVFDTQTSSRKSINLRLEPRTALVIGWDDETTVQIEGDAREPKNADLLSVNEAYFATWPDGRKRAASSDDDTLRHRTALDALFLL